MSPAAAASLRKSRREGMEPSVMAPAGKSLDLGELFQDFVLAGVDVRAAADARDDGELEVAPRDGGDQPERVHGEVAAVVLFDLEAEDELVLRHLDGVDGGDVVRDAAEEDRDYHVLVEVDLRRALPLVAGVVLPERGP